MSKGPHWTDEEERQLIELCRTGLYSESAMSVALDRSRTAVHKRLKRLGLSAPATRLKNLPGTRALIEDLYDKGVRNRDIVTQTGASATYVETVLREHRAGAPQPRASGRHREHLVAISQASRGAGFPYCVGRSA